jgi:tetraacyldisaccharide 4'-kinase
MKQDRFERIERFFSVVVQRRASERFWSRRIRLLLWFLRQLSHLYTSIVRSRLLLYEHGIFRHHTLGCQVISVGNLTVGGTGKTPVVEVFARELQREGRKVAILSRGYKKVEPGFFEKLTDRMLLRERSRPPRVVSDGSRLLLDSAMSGDEPYMLASNLHDVSVLVDKDRVKSGRYAINKLGCDTLILDDGFQYLALKHRVEIVLVDSTNPFGNEYTLPRGVLREPIRNIRRANFIFITKSDGSGVPTLKARLRELNPTAEIIECRHCARYVQNVFSAERKELDFLKGLKVVALSGIAAPAGFESEIERRGATLLDRHNFADHHRYSQQEIIDIINKSKQLGAEAIITTEKDAVRFPELHRWDVPTYFLRVDIEILSGEEDFRHCISRICFR